MQERQDIRVVGCGSEMGGSGDLDVSTIGRLRELSPSLRLSVIQHVDGAAHAGPVADTFKPPLGLPFRLWLRQTAHHLELESVAPLNHARQVELARCPSAGRSAAVDAGRNGRKTALS